MCAAPLPPQVLVKARATLPVIERLGFDLILERLFAARCLTLGVSDGDRKILQVRNVAAAGRKARPLLGAELGRYVLSRFCHAHRNSGRLCLLVPLHGYEATVEDDAMAVAVARLCSPVTLDDVGDGVAMRDALRLLVAIGALEQEGAEDPRLEIWEEHDLLFHLRARAGFHDHPSGATFRFGETRRMPPLRPEASRQAVPLCRPQGTPPPGSLFDVLERRRSTRDPAARALTVEQLSSLLYHSARITHVQETPAGVVATRPFPSGGALQELGLYLTVNRCQGLDRGCYRYDDLNHALDPVAADMGMLEHLLDGSAFSTMLGRRPDVLVIMAGRIERLEVKYEGIVYSLMLKHVGCVIQTFYLVATELDIGCCAVGDSNSALFARATGIDALIEPVLGELMLNGGPS
jgi:SagB-type dehydrogenase family enzyme